MKGLRVRGLCAAGAAAAALCAAAGAGSASAQIPPGMPTFNWAPTYWLSPELPAPEGRSFRIYGSKCHDGRIADMWLGTTFPRSDLSGPPPTSGACADTSRDSDSPILFWMMGSQYWMEAGFGMTAARVSHVDMLTKDGWLRVATAPVPAESVAAAGLPEGLRYFAHSRTWEWHGHDGPFFYQGAVAVTNNKIAGCSRELRCVKGASATRAGKYGKKVKRVRRAR